MTPAPLDAAGLDAADPLAHFRDRFVIDDDLIAYLDGNSLGRLPIATRDRLATFVRDEWGTDLIRGWERWTSLPSQVGDQIGALIGSAPGQTVLTDSTSICLFKLLHAAGELRPERTEVVVEAHAFPTDRFLVDAVAEQRGWMVRRVEHPSDLWAALGERTAVVVLGHVDYRTGELHDLPALTAAIHDAGALALWDLCHSVGAVPLDLDGDHVDLAVGCTYKYLNGGPGAPAFLHVAGEHLGAVKQPIPGWWSVPDLFAMTAAHEPAADARRMLSGTPNVAGMLAVQEGARLTTEAGSAAIRAKSIALTAFAIELLDAAGLEVVTPRDPARRGGQVSVRCEDAAGVARALVERGVVPDFRPPDLVRLGFSPLTTSFAEVRAGIEMLTSIVSSS